MSHDHITPHQPIASPTPPAPPPMAPAPQRPVYDSPPLQPSTWLDADGRVMSEEEPHDDQPTDEEDVGAGDGGRGAARGLPASSSTPCPTVGRT